MTIENIKSLKDKVYELEGLLELAQLREDKIDELAPLIEARIRSLTLPGDPVAEEAPVAHIAAEPSEDSGAAGLYEETVEETAPEMEPVSESIYEAPAAVEETYEDTAARSVMPTAGPKEKPTMKKPAFCLNDRFRFRRELFDNSDSEFSSALGMIAAMDSYDEAEEYFISGRGWDPENPEVMDFLEIIKIYFEG